MHEELAVAISPGDRRVGPPQDGAVGGPERCLDVGPDTVPHRWVGDHPTTSVDLGASRFELRLDQEHHRSTRLAHRDERIDDQSERDERQVTDDDIDLTAEHVGVDPPHVGPFQIDDTRVGAESLVQLPATDVDGEDARRSALQNAVGEAARRRTSIEHHCAGDVDLELTQSVIEFEAAASDEPRRWSVHRETVVRRNLAGGPLRSGTVDDHPMLLDEGLCLGPTRREATTDEFEIESSARRHGCRTVVSGVSSC